MDDTTSLFGGSNTYVSNPSGNAAGAPPMTSPGSQGPGSSMQVSHAVIWLIGGAAVALVSIGVLFRRPIGSMS